MVLIFSVLTIQYNPLDGSPNNGSIKFIGSGWFWSVPSSCFISKIFCLIVQSAYVLVQFLVSPMAEPLSGLDCNININIKSISMLKFFSHLFYHSTNAGKSKNKEVLREVEHVLESTHAEEGKEAFDLEDEKGTIEREDSEVESWPLE